MTNAVMDGSGAGHGADDLLDLPTRIFERLRQIAGYTWDETKYPLHTSYDNWHIFGTRFVSPYSATSSTLSPAAHNGTSPGFMMQLRSSRSSPADPSTPSASASDINNEHSAASPPANSSALGDTALVEEAVVARVSTHVLREERAFHIAKSLISTSDPNGEHIARPIDLLRLAPLPADKGAIIVAIYLHPGQNYLASVLDQGPAFYQARKVDDVWQRYREEDFEATQPISLQRFLDFAVGAAQCLEMIHHGQGVVHGEIRGDAFHFCLEKNMVKLTSFGSGLRSFEHGLTSTGWLSLSKELGAKNKLLYISPEQTGRLPAEPDTRTDIYSLGVLFWSLLTRRPVFEGETPLDIVQGVLGRRIPIVSAVRLDVPEVLGRIIQKCTSKNVGDRYHSVKGLRHDLQKVQEFLVEGDLLALKEWQIASKDVSSFFMLPAIMVGRTQEREQIVKIIEQVAKSHAVAQKGGTNRFSDGSSLSNELLDGADASSEGASSGDGNNRGSGSFTQAILSDGKTRSSYYSSIHTADAQTIAGEPVPSTHSHPSVLRSPPKPWERHQSVSFDTRSMVETLGSDREGSRHSGIPTDSSSSLSRHLGSVRLRRRGHCEIVTVEGIAGVGKSCLIETVLTEARRRGYCAAAKFNTTRRTAFGPLLKLLSSLFRQVWGERNTDTPFHQSLKAYVRPMWPVLHKMLGLPEFLLGPVEGSMVVRSLSTTHGSSYAKSSPSPPKRRGSSPSGASARTTKPPGSRLPIQSSQEFLRGATSIKSMRLKNTFLDVLRMFTNHKFICLCLDDLHYADYESLDLITQIISSRMRMVVIVTYRPEEISPETVQDVLRPPESEDGPRATRPTVTKIQLSPLVEDNVVQYVATTLCRPKEEVMALAMVIQAKTAGNPFFMREMLSACYRKKCVWFDYHDSRWHYDVSRIFEQFKGDSDYDTLDTDFITSRLNELPPASRSILAWAALVGNGFSFELICHLLAGDLHYIDETCPPPFKEHTHAAYSQADAVAGLQAAIQACIIIPGETDDRFRFAHDRYVQAAKALKECNSEKMHFVVAQTLMKHYGVDAKAKEATASHICESIEIIQKRVLQRRPYRKVLLDCARAATESGARATAAKYLGAALSLLQVDPWTDKDDASYDETLQLHLRLAECYLYMGQPTPAGTVLEAIFKSAKTALDKAPAYVLRSRISAQSGNALDALAVLKECLTAMNVAGVDDAPTYNGCDERFEKLSIKIQTMDRNDLVNPPRAKDPGVASIGAVLAEAISAGWWSDALSFYHLSLILLETHLNAGAFPQSGMAFLHASMIAVARFNMIPFAVDMGSCSLELLERFKDPYSMARGWMAFAIFLGHVQMPIAMTVTHLESSIEYGAAAGDRISAILSFGLAAQVKVFASENCSDLEAFCQYGCEEIPNWHQDTRGGTMIIAVRQISRALQGKTNLSDPREIMSDEQHKSSEYKAWLDQNKTNGVRSRLFYESLELVPLFLYGYYDQAVEVGKRCVDKGHLIWSARNTRFAMLFYGLALAGLVLRRRQDPRDFSTGVDAKDEETVAKLQGLAKKIRDWSTFSDVNYLAWSRLLEAQISEISDDTRAIRQYEEALDHASEHSFVFEEALGNYLMAGLFIRGSARRSARAALRDAVGLFRQLGATGVADRIDEEHSLLLHGPMHNPRTTDAGVQTDFAGDTPSVQYQTAVGNEDGAADRPALATALADLRGDRIGAWRGSMQPEIGAGLPALDMIDLHAILQSSQVISSVLRVDELLKTMCDVILQTCGGAATLAALVVQDEDDAEWCVAASGDPEKGAEAHIPGISLTGTHLVAENVVLYSTRFREAVFIADLINDERFGNVADCWLHKNPLSKAVIAIPICHGSKPLLGVLYLEGMPGSFTDRNVTVLQLLVNQIGISYSNALTIKKLEKVSAENESMIAIQKAALARSIAAEGKAKKAEQEARRNVQLAEAAEKEAKRNMKLAEEAAKAKGRFLANISHELRTPLNGVIGNSELLRDSRLSSDQQDMAESIRLSADLLLTVINDILDFSRMEADKMKLHVIAFNPKEMVQEVVRAVSYRNQEKTSKGVVEIMKQINLPPNVLVYGDPVRLHQVLGNLIGNSIKFTERGSITIGARIESETDDTAALSFWVQDTGIGIPPKQLPKLFQPFSQADPSTARKYGGSGLGLSICKSLIEAIMKGRIYLESTEGVGTKASFTVTFDKARADATAGDVQTKTAAQAASEPPSRSPSREASPNPYMDLSQVTKDQLRVCIAEDNPINRKIAIQFLQRLGYKTIDAYDNGLAAVEALREKAGRGQPYHVVLMDVQMPVLDGYEATKLLRQDALEPVRTVLVIAMTASAIQGDREKCLAAGMNDYLAKPVKSDVLKRKLDAYIGVQHFPDQTPSPSESRSSTSSGSGTPSVLGMTNGVLPGIAAGEKVSSNGRLPDPSRLSGDTRLSDADTATTASSGGAPTKRLLRKLTKSRGNSEVGIPPTDSGPKPKAVLQKKNRAPAADGGLDRALVASASSLAPDGAKKPDDGRRSHSFASAMSSASKES